jgi:hypothetical protein
VEHEGPLSGTQTPTAEKEETEKPDTKATQGKKDGKQRKGAKKQKLDPEEGTDSQAASSGLQVGIWKSVMM